MNYRKTSLVAKVVTAFSFTSLVLGAGMVTSARFGTLPVAYAQNAPDNGGGGAPQGRHGRMGAVLKSLNLSPDQAAKVKQIVGQAREQNQNADPETRRANMKAAFQNIRNNVLTPDQQKKFDAAMQSMSRQNGQH